MKDSGTVLVSYHANDPNVGMSATIDLAKFKMYICDTVLFTTLMFKDRDFPERRDLPPCLYAAVYLTEDAL